MGVNVKAASSGCTIDTIDRKCKIIKMVNY